MRLPRSKLYKVTMCCMPRGKGKRCGCGRCSLTPKTRQIAKRQNSNPKAMEPFFGKFKTEGSMASYKHQYGETKMGNYYYIRTPKEMKKLLILLTVVVFG